MLCSFVDLAILTSVLLIMSKSACYKNANIGSLSVEKLIVKDLKVNGTHDLPINNNTQDEIIENILKELENLRQENNILKERLNNLKLNGLLDVDTTGRTEDGAFIGWASSENSWVPYPEVGN